MNISQLSPQECEHGATAVGAETAGDEVNISEVKVGTKGGSNGKEKGKWRPYRVQDLGFSVQGSEFRSENGDHIGFRI